MEMGWCGGMRRILRISVGAAVVPFLMLVAACGGGDDASEEPGPGAQIANVPASAQPTTVAQPASEPTTEASPAPPTPTRTSVPVIVLTPKATPTTAPASSPTSAPAAPTLSLKLLSPQDGAGVEIGVVGVLGKARPDAVVAENGIPVDVGIDGAFRHDVVLDDGANLIEVVASSLDGGFESEDAAVFLVSPAAGLPFSLLFPPDGLEVFEPQVEVLGATRPDAIVGINGVPLATNPLGIFFTTIPLEEGPNLIEVVATDISSNVRFQTVVIFYTP